MSYFGEIIWNDFLLAKLFGTIALLAKLFGMIFIGQIIWNDDKTLLLTMLQHLWMIKNCLDDETIFMDVKIWEETKLLAALVYDGCKTAETFNVDDKTTAAYVMKLFWAMRKVFGV